MKNLAEQTLANIVLEQYQTVSVLEKYNLDFCCKGKRSLKTACEEKGLSLDHVLSELDPIINKSIEKDIDFNSMTSDELITHIVLHHHFYVKQSLPNILSHVERVATKHGDRYPYMIEVFEIFKEVFIEMFEHMQKEETVLFPRIKELELFYKDEHKVNLVNGFISMPVKVMEDEHEKVGDALFKIRELTNNYTAPESACTTFRISLEELKEFETDLHKHVHLENNILFPQAKKMFDEIRVVV